MSNNFLDKSNYLKGLLILIGKDKKIAVEEREEILRLAKILGFDREFCENAVNELLENEYIIEEPPLFSRADIAEAFIKDGIKLAFADNDIHLYELNWLQSVTAKNNLSADLCIKELNEFKKNKSRSTDRGFAIEQVLVQ